MVKNHGTKLNVEISEKLEKISKNSKQILNKEKKYFKNVDQCNINIDGSFKQKSFAK